MENEKLIQNTQKLFSGKLKVINVGLPHFADTLRTQGVDVEQVDWKPVAGGDKKLGSLLDTMGFDD
jgi:FdrA protein